MSARRWLAIGVLAAALVAAFFGARLGALGPSIASPSSAVTYHDLRLSSLHSTHHRIAADLYLPEKAASKPPLVVFLQANDPVRADDTFVAAAGVGDAMQRRGIATLALRFGLSAGDSIRSRAADIASVIPEIGRGYDFSHVVLVGRGAGALMAAMLALDRRLLQGAGFDPKKIGGVVGVRGTYDLTGAALAGHPERAFFASHAEDRRESSPATFVRGDAPPFLLINGGDDDGIWPRLSRSFAGALERAGTVVDSYVVPGRDGHSITYWSGNGNELGELVMSFVVFGPRPAPIDSTFGVRQRWSKKPPLDNDDFWTDKALIETHPIDEGFMSTVMVMFHQCPYELNTLPGKTYQSMDLLAYLSTRPESEVGKGDYLVTTNIRGEQQYFSREDLKKTKPVIVVGMDDETNLYRLFMHYRLKQAYSWKKGEEPMPTMIRPLGAFMHFPSPPPPHMRNKSYAAYGLTSKSFHWLAADPLKPVRELTGGLRDAMLGEQGCLTCHSFRGVGANSHHNLAIDGRPYGAFALPLEEYPPEVLRRFLFEQDAVAKSFDVSPLRVEPDVAKSLFEMVTRQRK